MPSSGFSAFHSEQLQTLGLQGIYLALGAPSTQSLDVLVVCWVFQKFRSQRFPKGGKIVRHSPKPYRHSNFPVLRIVCSTYFLFFVFLESSSRNTPKILRRLFGLYFFNKFLQTQKKYWGLFLLLHLQQVIRTLCSNNFKEKPKEKKTKNKSNRKNI